MKIALVSMTFLPSVGGAEFVVDYLARCWCRQGHNVCVMNSQTDQPPDPDAPYSVRKLALWRGSTRFGYHRFPFQWLAVRRLSALLDAYQPDFISAHYGYPTAMWLAQIKTTSPWVVTCHGGELTKFEWGYRKQYGISAILADALNRSSGAIAISMHARKLMEELGVNPKTIRDIPNGVDLERFRKDVSFDLRANFRLTSDALVILSVGREHPAKAFDTGIRAFAKIADQVPEVHYLIVGRNTEKWQPLADELGVGKRVIFCRGLYGDDLVGAYQQADIFFSPSVSELFSLVVLEGMGAGLPAVVTNVSGSQDAILTGKNGFVVEPDHPDEMAAALLKLLTDEILRKRMGTANLERAQSYAWDLVSRMYLECV